MAGQHSVFCSKCLCIWQEQENIHNNTTKSWKMLLFWGRFFIINIMFMIIAHGSLFTPYVPVFLAY